MSEKYIQLSGNTVTLRNFHVVDNFIEIESSTGFELNMGGEVYKSGIPGNGLLKVNFEYGIERDNGGFLGSGNGYEKWIVPAEDSISFVVNRKGGSFKIRMTSRDVL